MMESIRNHPDVVVHGEIFNPENIEWHIDKEILPQFDFALRESNPIEFMKTVFQLKVNRRGVGFKLLFGQNDDALDWVLRQSDIRKVFMHRPNILAQFASGKLAERTGLWNHREETGDASDKVPFDSEEFIEYCSWLEPKVAGTKEILRENSQEFIEVPYQPRRINEDVSRVMTWLGLSTMETPLSDLKRLYSNDIVDRFENADVVLETLNRLGRIEWCVEE
jgi:LPS sulfotransferase NodH